MARLYGHKWTSVQGLKDGGNVWYAALGDLEPYQLQIGLRKCTDKYDWPPSAPEFKKLCLEIPDLPSLEDAYREATSKTLSPSRKPWSHAVVYHAGKEYGWYLLSRDTEKQSRPRFEKIYTDICQRFAGGEEFKPPERNERALEKHSNGERLNTEENKKAAKSALDKLKRSF